MRAEEAWIGARVRVRKNSPKSRLRGLVGTVAKAYGPPGRRALQVRFDDGLWQLLWPQDVIREPRGVREGAGHERGRPTP